MKVITTYGHDNSGYDGRDSYEIEVDGEVEIRVGRPEPEDATLTRDLSFAYSIVTLMKKAWEAGKRGEDFTLETVADND